VYAREGEWLRDITTDRLALRNRTEVEVVSVCWGRLSSAVPVGGIPKTATIDADPVEDRWDFTRFKDFTP
jgi:hypothetical protein